MLRKSITSDWTGEVQGAANSTLEQTGCLAVNAAFLQEIKQDNQFLDELLHATHNALAAIDYSKFNARASVELLRRLRDRLAMHFSLEEAFGYFENALEFPPELSVLAEACRRQHETLYLDVCAVVELAESLLYQPPEEPIPHIRHIAAEYDKFYTRIQRHDADENDLIWAAMERRENKAL